MEPSAKRTHRHPVFFPKRQHRQILRIGKPYLVQQRLVELRHQQRCGIERKAELIIEKMRVFRCGHLSFPDTAPNHMGAIPDDAMKLFALIRDHDPSNRASVRSSASSAAALS